MSGTAAPILFKRHVDLQLSLTFSSPATARNVSNSACNFLQLSTIFPDKTSSVGQQKAAANSHSHFYSCTVLQYNQTQRWRSTAGPLQGHLYWSMVHSLGWCDYLIIHSMVNNCPLILSLRYWYHRHRLSPQTQLEVTGYELIKSDRTPSLTTKRGHYNSRHILKILWTILCTFCSQFG